MYPSLPVFEQDLPVMGMKRTCFPYLASFGPSLKRCRTNRTSDSESPSAEEEQEVQTSSSTRDSCSWPAGCEHTPLELLCCMLEAEDPFEECCDKRLEDTDETPDLATEVDDLNDLALTLMHFANARHSYKHSVARHNSHQQGYPDTKSSHSYISASAWVAAAEAATLGDEELASDVDQHMRDDVSVASLGRWCEEGADAPEVSLGGWQDGFWTAERSAPFPTSRNQEPACSFSFGSHVRSATADVEDDACSPCLPPTEDEDFSFPLL